MKRRALLCALAMCIVSLTSGCFCCHECFPNLGWRFRGCCCCGHVNSAPVSTPVAFRPPMVVASGPECPRCPPHGGNQPAGYPPIAYPPVIGNPMPIPGANVIPSSELPQPMPAKSGN
jgi:hypothetical protein